MYDVSAVPADVVPNPVLATPKQVQFIAGLIDERDLFASPKHFEQVNAMDAEEYAAHLDWMKASAAKLTKRQASEWIERLLALPKKPVAAQADTDVPAVPAGRYALVDPDDELNPVKFYKVNDGKKGTRWEGFTFVDRFVGDDTFPVKGHSRISTLKAIAADPLAAAQLFGREEARCCKCGRNLTRRLSRHLGIGPVCGQRNGWFDGDLVAEARAELKAQGLDPDEEVSA